ncbi:hypothetical protein [Rhizobium leguminosarum]|uniref:hypothetical protein n=1 Tax=Rhizobium leguminosarum TaxID=384 RepID=UPI001FDFCE5D|nr:hypothetical protein [Rhizobium leguminosarum]
MSTTLFEILKKLDYARIHYHIGRYRSDTVDITATFVGKRLEISVFDDGHVEVSEFRGMKTFSINPFLTMQSARRSLTTI